MDFVVGRSFTSEQTNGGVKMQNVDDRIVGELVSQCAVI
jgi:hypothetical protein